MLGSVICVVCRGVQARNELWFELQSCLGPRWEYMKGASLWTGFLVVQNWMDKLRANIKSWSLISFDRMLDLCSTCFTGQVSGIYHACSYHCSMVIHLFYELNLFNFTLFNYFQISLRFKIREKFFFINHLWLNIFLKDKIWKLSYLEKKYIYIYLHIYESF